MSADELFVDLEIRIFPRRDEGYPVYLRLGEQQEFPRGHLTTDILLWVSYGDPVTDGQRLFELLFADPVLHDAWIEARGQAPQRRMRLWIDIGAAELHRLPWELLRDGDKLLSADADTPFSRYLPIKTRWGERSPIAPYGCWWQSPTLTIWSVIPWPNSTLLRSERH